MIDEAVNISLSVVPKKVSYYGGPQKPYRKYFSKPRKPLKPRAVNFSSKSDTVVINGKIMALSKGPGGVIVLKDPQPSNTDLVAYNQALADYKVKLEKYNQDMNLYKQKVAADKKRVAREKLTYKERLSAYKISRYEQNVLQAYNALRKLQKKAVKNGK
jgi:hypothetical protein